MPHDSEEDRAYTEWLNQKISAARGGLVDGFNKVYTEEEWAKIRRAKEAMAHDAWFRAEVEQGLKEADDPNTQWVSNEEVKAIYAKQRAALLRRRP